jgi:hypothetical protein
MCIRPVLLISSNDIHAHSIICYLLFLLQLFVYIYIYIYAFLNALQITIFPPPHLLLSAAAIRLKISLTVFRLPSLIQ